MKWLRPELAGLQPYYQPPLAGDPVRLDQNTNLAGRNPAIDRVDPNTLDLAQYPTRDADSLRQALAAHHHLEPDHFLAVNGSDEALDLVIKAFCPAGSRMVVEAPSYSLYPFYATLGGLEFVEVHLRGSMPHFRHDVDGLLARDGRVTLVASPNNPTGSRIPTSDLEHLVASSQGLVIIDEAYAEYAGSTVLEWVRRYDNLLVMRTMSKAHGLAGLRVGYLAGSTDLMADLRLVKPPYNLNAYSEAVAVQALEDTQWMEAHVADVIAEREALAEGLRRLGVQVHASDANFLLCRTPIDAGIVHKGLLERGFLARTFAGKAGLEDCIRLTVADGATHGRLLAALAGILEAT